MQESRELDRDGRAKWNKQESLCNWCLKVSCSLLHNSVWLTDGLGKSQTQVCEMRCYMGANEAFSCLIPGTGKLQQRIRNQSSLISCFFHPLCDLSQLQKGETILKLNLGFCSNFCFGLAQAYPFPHVRYNHKNVREVQIVFVNAFWRKAFPNFFSLFHILGFWLLLNLFLSMIFLL